MEIDNAQLLEVLIEFGENNNLDVESVKIFLSNFRDREYEEYMGEDM